MEHVLKVCHLVYSWVSHLSTTDILDQRILGHGSCCVPLAAPLASIRLRWGV